MYSSSEITGAELMLLCALRGKPVVAKNMEPFGNEEPKERSFRVEHIRNSQRLVLIEGSVGWLKTSFVEKPSTEDFYEGIFKLQKPLDNFELSVLLAFKYRQDLQESTS